MNVLIILNDPPYGTERSYNIGRRVRSAARKGADVGACGTCMDASGLSDDDLLEGVHRSTMDELGTWTLAAPFRVIPRDLPK